MSKYKTLMLKKGVMQKTLLDHLRREDLRIDKSLLSKICNDVCLPTKSTLDNICRVLSCNALDLYDRREIELAPKENLPVAPATIKTRNRRQISDFYNLTVEIPRELAERVFSKAALRKLGYLSKTDFVRQAVEELDAQLTEINKKGR